jgi:hypothetical protein
MTRTHDGNSVPMIWRIILNSDDRTTNSLSKERSLNIRCAQLSHARATLARAADLDCGFDAASLRLVYSALAKTFAAFGRIDFAARF